MHPDRIPSTEAPGENLAPHVQGSASHSRTNQYAQLKRLIKQNGLQTAARLLRSQVRPHPRSSGGEPDLTVRPRRYLVAAPLNAAYLAFVFVQISLLAHDFGHRQFSFRAPWKNDWLTLVFGNLLLGLSRQWWIDKHNEHHGHPNQLDIDPDVDIPLLAFEEEQALDKRGLARSVVKYQAALIFPLSLLQAISMLRSSIEFLAAKKAGARWSRP